MNLHASLPKITIAICLSPLLSTFSKQRQGSPSPTKLFTYLHDLLYLSESALCHGVGREEHEMAGCENKSVTSSSGDEVIYLPWNCAVKVKLRVHYERLFHQSDLIWKNNDSLFFFPLNVLIFFNFLYIWRMIDNIREISNSVNAKVMHTIIWKKTISWKLFTYFVDVRISRKTHITSSNKQYLIYGISFKNLFFPFWVVEM